MIELTENDNQGREDEEVECEVKPDTSTTFIRYTSLSLWLIRKKMINPQLQSCNNRFLHLFITFLGMVLEMIRFSHGPMVRFRLL